MNPPSDNLLGILSFLYAQRRKVLMFCGVVALGSVIISLFLPNYYRATTIFYPASPELANPELIFGYTGQVTNYYGGDRDLDRLAEIANSREVMDYLITRFGLYEHYKIDSTARFAKHKVRKRFRKLYSALKNRNDAIELSVEDQDKQLAAEMANAARDKINEIAVQMIKRSQERLLASFENNIYRKKQELQLLSDSIQTLQRRYSIYNVGVISERLSTRLADAETEITRNRAKLEVLEKDTLVPRDTLPYIRANLSAFESERRSLLSDDVSEGVITVKRFNEAASLINVVNDLHFQARRQLSYDLERYNQIMAAYKTEIPAIHLLEAAEAPPYKSRPTRTLLVVAAVFAAFIFSVLGLLLLDSIKQMRVEVAA
ncbi:MAG: hypothetical protein ACK4NS_11900 [Saprospiraceae bacterium]